MKIKKSVITLLGCCCFITLMTGCASVMCGTKQSVVLDSKPSGAEVMVYDRHCEVVFEGTTPCVAKLRRCEPEEDRASYIILVKKEGFLPVQIPLKGRLNRAYLANALYGGVGFIADPFTGAMWTLTTTRVDPHLVQDDTSFVAKEEGGGFSVALKEQSYENVAAHAKSSQD
jgi:hypothetical protein